MTCSLTLGGATTALLNKRKPAEAHLSEAYAP